MGADVGASDDLSSQRWLPDGTWRESREPGYGTAAANVVEWIALYAQLPWPAAIMTRPEIDQHCAGTAPTGFAADVEQLEVLLERVAMRDRRDQWPEHPIFGRMSRGAWLRWAYLHADHHLRQFGA
jgi:hypothetical protein